MQSLRIWQDVCIFGKRRDIFFKVASRFFQTNENVEGEI